MLSQCRLEPQLQIKIHILRNKVQTQKTTNNYGTVWFPRPSNCFLNFISSFETYVEKNKVSAYFLLILEHKI